MHIKMLDNGIVSIQRGFTSYLKYMESEPYEEENASNTIKIQ